MAKGQKIIVSTVVDMRTSGLSAKSTIASATTSPIIIHAKINNIINTTVFLPL